MQLLCCGNCVHLVQLKEKEKKKYKQKKRRQLSAIRMLRHIFSFISPVCSLPYPSLQFSCFLETQLLLEKHQKLPQSSSYDCQPLFSPSAIRTAPCALKKVDHLMEQFDLRLLLLLYHRSLLFATDEIKLYMLINK